MDLFPKVLLHLVYIFKYFLVKSNMMEEIGIFISFYFKITNWQIVAEDLSMRNYVDVITLVECEEVMEEVGYRDASSFKYFDDLSVNVEINYPWGSGHG